MTEREKKFFKNLIISEEDFPRAQKYIQSKGIEKHIIIKEKLLAWSNKPEIEYTKVASVYRYDKRLRIVLFKYISYLEEFYRSIIFDNYYNSVYLINSTKELKEKIQKTNNLNDALELLDFSSLIKQVKRLPERKMFLLGFPKEHLSNNLKALKGLRNAVMHNKFLLLYRGFETCYVKGVDNGKSSSLKANILNLLSFLPDAVREKCIWDINSCSEDRNTLEDSSWDLPDLLCIKI